MAVPERNNPRRSGRSDFKTRARVRCLHGWYMKPYAPCCMGHARGAARMMAAWLHHARMAACHGFEAFDFDITQLDSAPRTF
jgi:hypothetical protein